MKKILLFSLILALVSASASAQSVGRSRVRKQGIGQGQLTRIEKMELRKDVVRNQVMRKRARRDGIVTPIERRRLHRAQCETRRDLTRFRHNGPRRVI